MSELAMIIPAAGASRRFGAGRSKLLEMLGDWPVVVHAVRACARVGDVFMAAGDVDEMRGVLEQWGVSERVRLCGGGACRAESVLNALREVPPSYEWVAVHDAARPFASGELIDRVLKAAVEHGAAGPAVAVAATVKQAAGPLPARVERTLPREELWAMQTPQIMRRRELLEAFERCPIPLDRVTDDLQLLELAGREVWLVAGEEGNIKITTRVDLAVAEVMMREE
jgi:2-C-methyl-D-erythritol 4-phosphate cytidylyltransferase